MAGFKENSILCYVRRRSCLWDAEVIAYGHGEGRRGWNTQHWNTSHSRTGPSSSSPSSGEEASSPAAFLDCLRRSNHQAMGRQNVMPTNIMAVHAQGFLKALSFPSRPGRLNLIDCAAPGPVGQRQSRTTAEHQSTNCGAKEGRGGERLRREGRQSALVVRTDFGEERCCRAENYERSDARRLCCTDDAHTAVAGHRNRRISCPAATPCP